MTSRSAWIPCARRLMEMVAVLHRQGYERLRVMPYEYPIAWRLLIGPLGVFSVRNGAYAPHGDEASATYSSADEARYFGWADAEGNDAAELARKFLNRFAGVAQAGRGDDADYAAWYVRLLARVQETGQLPFVMAEYFDPPPLELDFLPLRNYAGGGAGRFELPPPGLIAHAG